MPTFLAAQYGRVASLLSIIIILFPSLLTGPREFLRAFMISEIGRQ